MKWGAILIVLALAGCMSSAGAGSSSSSDDPADLLASRDGSSDVAVYRALLDVWDSDCTQGRVDSAGIVDATYDDEQAHGGSDRSRLAVMRHLIRSVPRSVAPTDCTSIAAAYTVLVESR